MKAYYAHCKALYNTPQEKRDVEEIAKLGFWVVNPNSVVVADAMAKLKADIAAKEASMDYFKRFSLVCDICVFRALPDGRIPSGVASEIKWFQELGKPVLELPSRLASRMISLDETREYLREVGQR